MAIFYEGVCCPICERPIEMTSDFFATSEPFFPPEHPLWRYCDAAIHWECYASWPHRTEFARAYFDTCIANESGNRYWGMALRTDALAVQVSIDIGQVIVLTASTGDSERVPLDQWETWLANFEDATATRFSLQQEALREALPELRWELPTADALIARVDWDAKAQLMREYEISIHNRMHQFRIDEEERLRRTSAYNKAFRRLVRRGVHCPYCAAEDIQLLDHGPERKSRFLCASCGRSFGPPEVNTATAYGLLSADNVGRD